MLELRGGGTASEVPWEIFGSFSFMGKFISSWTTLNLLEAIFLFSSLSIFASPSHFYY